MSSISAQLNKYLILIVALTLFACDNAVDTSPDGGIGLTAYPMVTVLYSSSAMGDSGYNDLICTGTYRAQQKENFLIQTLVPDSIGEGKRMLLSWLEADHSQGRHLLIVASDEYESLLREKAKDVPDDDNCRVILLESKIDDLPVYTFHISMYGISYIAGALAAKITTDGNEVLVLRANAENQMIADAATGFCNGYLNSGGSQVTDLSLSAFSGHGFTNAQNMYKLCEVGAFDKFRFLYPLIGGSINGVFQYYTETLNLNQLWVAGVDNDKSQFALIVPFSLLKHIDEAVESYILDWVRGAPMPRHQRLGLRSGHTEFFEGLWQDYDSQYLEDLKAEAMRLEDEFEN